MNIRRLVVSALATSSLIQSSAGQSDVLAGIFFRGDGYHVTDDTYVNSDAVQRQAVFYPKGTTLSGRFSALPENKKSSHFVDETLFANGNVADISEDEIS
ncbi:MAG: hypothetical protein K0U24_03305, partial [Gammaproteobacteria bacterium]|nr:hypothetical protein [Gammaproteobacteria bacterium]